jgi:hypothetical protein
VPRAARRRRRAVLQLILCLGTGPLLSFGELVRPFEPLGPCSRRTGLVISEIMYHPATRADGKVLEFVELFNSRIFSEDLSGCRLAGDIAFTFPEGTILKAGAFLVVAKAPADVASVCGLSGVLGPYKHRLPHGAGRIRLRNEQDSVLLEVNYESGAPWPGAAAGAGHSLVMARPSYGEDDPRAWEASDRVGGSPGRAKNWQPDPLRQVVVNEYLLQAKPPFFDFIELYNASPRAVDLAGASLGDRPNRLQFRIPAGTVLGPRGFVVLSAARLGFSLQPQGAIYIVNSDGTRVVEALRLRGQAPNASRGRHPDGAPFWSELAAPTPGALNAGPLRHEMVINEIMCHPISGANDDQYIELYNRGAKAVDLGGWQLSGAIHFTFPPGAAAPPGGYTVVARNLTNLLAACPQLTRANTFGNCEGPLKHSGRIALERPMAALPTNRPDPNAARESWLLVNEVNYRSGSRRAHWSDGGGASLELADPEADNRFAAAWADSDETSRATNWTTIEHTGVLEFGNPNYPANAVQILMLGEGECLVDNVEVLFGGRNLLANGNFESGAAGWLFEGNHERTTLETSGGWQSAHSLHVRASGPGDTYANRLRAPLTQSLPSGATATLRAKVRWLRGHPEILLRLRGNWLEATGPLLLPRCVGTPGARNSRFVARAGPLIADVLHRPVLPVAQQSVVISARVQHPPGSGPVVLNWRVDPSTEFASVVMKDDGSDGDELAGDGVFSATIPGQSAGSVVAFYVEATDDAAPPARARFPEDAPGRECLVRFGETQLPGGLGTYRVWLTRATFNRWSTRNKASHEPLDCTFVSDPERVIYNVGARFSGSPYKAFGLDTPTGNMCDYHFRFPADDKLLGAAVARVSFPGNVDGRNLGLDHTAQIETTSFWIARQLGLPYQELRHVNLFLHGARRGAVVLDMQEPNHDLVKELFPEDNKGEFFKLSPWYEADTAGVDDAARSAIYTPMAKLPSADGAKCLARYRWSFQRRGFGGSANDYTNWFRLVDALNSPAAGYTEAVEALVDAPQWMRVFAYEHLVNNWESFGYMRAVNMFPYKGERGPWRLIPTDVDISFYGHYPTMDLFYTADPALARMNSHPPFRRAYWQALHEAANGPLLPMRVGPLVDARYAALRANGIAVAPPESIKSFIAGERNYVLGQLRQVAASFAIDRPAFSTNGPVASLSGTAPLEVARLTVNGTSRPVTWRTATAWTLSVPLSPGTNALTIAGWDQRGRPCPGASSRVTIVRLGDGAGL